MKLKDIADMEDYLNDRCYCPGEIYDMTGFFYQVFTPDTECTRLCKGSRGSVHGEFVIAQANDKTEPQIIYIETDDDKVIDCIRIDATEHNVVQILFFLSGKIEKMCFDEYTDTNTVESLNNILTIADAIINA